MMMNSPLYMVNGKRCKTQKEYRNELRNSQFSNAYKPWSQELDWALLSLKNEMSITELALLFKRKRGAIFSRLRKLEERGITQEVEEIGNQAKGNDSIFELIIKGVHPLTGEILSEESIWMHSSIQNDLKALLKK